MKLIVQPGDGVDSLLKAIKKAKKSVEVVIFRFDRPEIQRALEEAVERGVFVHALIAFTNRGGEKHLRKLETEFLAAGITVARTAGDLVRYHGKMMIVDRKELFLLAFNFTHLDTDHSRSFGLVTRNPKLIQDAACLFESDTKRQSYPGGKSKLLVSPVNARKELAAFIKSAKKQLLIYDPKVSDRIMLRLMKERERAGVEIRVIGAVAGNRLPSRELNRMRLHTRTIIKDGKTAFLGSMSLRQLELDARREIGVIFRDRSVISTISRIFEEDWSAGVAPKQDAKGLPIPVEKTAKKMAKVIVKNLPMEPVVRHVTKAIKKNGGNLDHAEVAETVRSAMKATVKEVVKDVAKEAVKGMLDEALEREEAEAR